MCEPITGVWEQSPWWGSGAKPPEGDSFSSTFIQKTIIIFPVRTHGRLLPAICY